MNNKSEYVIQKTEKSFCVNCRSNLHLLCHEDMKKGEPAFYICFTCKSVREVGKGEICKPPMD